jgi:iron-sulfur cluster repair protein YtfE (RIC family)
MSAINSPRTQSAAVEHVMHEHDALRDKVRRIHSVLAEPTPAQAEIDMLLREFSDMLIVHFANEEDQGFFTEVTSRAPRLSRQADRLCVEHRDMLHDAEELCRFATAGSPSMPWWRELSERCHEFNKRLMHHESEENKLLQEANQAEIGACD